MGGLLDRPQGGLKLQLELEEFTLLMSVFGILLALSFTDWMFWMFWIS